MLQYKHTILWYFLLGDFASAGTTLRRRGWSDPNLPCKVGHQCQGRKLQIRTEGHVCCDLDDNIQFLQKQILAYVHTRSINIQYRNGMHAARFLPLGYSFDKQWADKVNTGY